MPREFDKYPLTIAPEDWEETGVAGDETPCDPRARLLASIKINGLSMHLEALAVRTDDEGLQVAADSTWHDEVAELQNRQDTAFQTVEIAGRDYILVATPFGS